MAYVIVRDVILVGGGGIDEWGEQARHGNDVG